MKIYRFSIAWTRILLNGDTGIINKAGIDHYNKVIDKALEYGLEPMITLYHFDLPQHLQDLGGWINSDMPKFFEAYANVVFQGFCDRIKYWVTLNEPTNLCNNGYGQGTGPPLLNWHGFGEYICVHNMLKAHGLAYRLYEKIYYERFKGQVGLALVGNFFYSPTNNSYDLDIAMQFELGWFAHPIFSAKGNYPKVMIERIANMSEQEGRSRSRLPVFTSDEIEMLKGSADFLGCNYYTSQYVESTDQPMGDVPSYNNDQMLRKFADPSWKQAKSTWLYSVPSGIRDILLWIKVNYNNVAVFITENGFSDDGQIKDKDRIQYLHDHLAKLLEVLLNYESNLKGYIAWSIIDNFEWSSGYTVKFGLFSVNYESLRRERTPKVSAEFMHELILTQEIPDIKESYDGNLN